MDPYENELFMAAIDDFIRYFGDCDPLVTTENYAGEKVIVVESDKKKAIYSMKVELLKVINKEEV